MAIGVVELLILLGILVVLIIGGVGLILFINHLRSDK